MEVAATVCVVNENDSTPLTFRLNTFKPLHCSTVSLRNQDRDFIITVKPQGNVFKVIDNVRKYDKSYIDCGFVRIGFLQPKQDLLVCSAPSKLKMFFRAVEVIMSRPQEPLSPKCFLRSTSSGESNYVYEKRIFQQDYVTFENNIYFNVSKECERKSFKFNISGLNIIKIDTAVFSLSFLSILELYNNSLNEIPEEMGSMPNLKILNLAHNYLEDGSNWKWLSSPIIKGNLNILDLSYNKLTKVSNFIMHLRQLQSLDLMNNCINELPMSLGNLENLKYLYINGNRLRILPGSIQNLHNLCGLFITENDFRIYSKQDPKLTQADFKVKTLFRAAAEVTVRTIEYYRYDNMLPDRLADYLQDKIKYCYCGLPMFDDNAQPFYRELTVNMNVSDIDSNFKIPVIIYICSYKCFIAFRLQKFHQRCGFKLG